MRLFSYITNIFWLFRLLWILSSHQVLLPLLQRKTLQGEKLSLALEKLGPSFIKLGQALSIRSDIVGENVATALSYLQDKLPPFSSRDALAIIERELEKPLTELFSAFDEVPMAAASIAQVHQAWTLEGKKVAVKVLRPGIEKAFARDISLFFWVARHLERWIPKSRRLKPVEVIRTFEEMVKYEMDLRFEAAAASELKENCQHDMTVYIPEVHWQLTAKRVLTTEWVDGIPIHNKNALIAAGFNLNTLASNIAVSFFNQAYRDGFFHADLHPGNVMVDPMGRIVMVDFGIMGRLDQDTRIYVAEILRGFLNRDYMHVANVHFDAGYVPSYQSRAAFAQACRSIGEPIIGMAVNQISIARLLSQLFKVTEDFHMETQPQLLLLQKTMVLVEGLGSMLNPDVNMWQLAAPWMERWARENMGMQAKLRNMLKALHKILLHLPDFCENLEQMMEYYSNPKSHPLHCTCAICVERV